MKLILSIVNHDDAGAVTSALTKRGFSSTKLATTGGFLMSGNATLIVGVDEEKVQTVIDIIKEQCHSRKQMIPTATEMSYGYYPSMPVEVVVGGATIFVVDIERFERV
ncbi:MAG: transcriptional regulator [Oscillospiraceae bacterium]|nr:transcriptional regulator [Oscillospiraceae bacterium]